MTLTELISLAGNGTAFQVEGIIKVAIVILAVLLLVLSVSTYRKTGIKKMIFAAAAFSLFAIQLLVEYLEESVFHALDGPYLDIVLATMTLVILIFFLLFIIKKQKPRIVDKF